MGLRGRAGWGQIKASSDLRVGPLQAVTVGPTRAVIAILARYGFGRARAYRLIIDGKAYDSKAILGVAYRHATGQPLGPEDFSGGAAAAARVLRSLGFEVRNERIMTN